MNEQTTKHFDMSFNNKLPIKGAIMTDDNIEKKFLVYYLHFVKKLDYSNGDIHKKDYDKITGVVWNNISHWTVVTDTSYDKYSFDDVFEKLKYNIYDHYNSYDDIGNKNEYIKWFKYLIIDLNISKYGIDKINHFCCPITNDSYGDMRNNDNPCSELIHGNDNPCSAPDGLLNYKHPIYNSITIKIDNDYGKQESNDSQRADDTIGRKQGTPRHRVEIGGCGRGLEIQHKRRETHLIQVGKNERRNFQGIRIKSKETRPSASIGA